MLDTRQQDFSAANATQQLTKPDITQYSVYRDHHLNGHGSFSPAVSFTAQWSVVSGGWCHRSTAELIFITYNSHYLICMKSHYSEGLSQRVAYCYPTGVTLLHTSSPSPLRERLWTAPWAGVGPEAAREEVAGWSLIRCGAWLHQPRGRTEPWQEERAAAEPCHSGGRAPVVAW